MLRLHPAIGVLIKYTRDTVKPCWLSALLVNHFDDEHNRCQRNVESSRCRPDPAGFVRGLIT